MKRCPYCSEEILDTAVKCKHCGEFLKRDDAVGDARTGAAVPQTLVLLDRYEIDRELGRGGMGVVYLARDRERRGAEVAIKVLPPELSNDPHAVEDLQHEADLAMSLSHPNIVRLHNLEHDRAKQTRFLVMEFVKGRSLAEVGVVPPDVANSHVRQALRGLTYAHKQKIVHRDLKPSNLMLDGDTVKITDFGIARRLRDSMTRLTGRAQSGTLLYMSPEQLRGENVGPATDLYSMGCVLYELMAGRPPFHTGSIEWQIVNQMPSRPGGVPDALWSAILRAMAKRPEDRFADAEEFGAVLSADRESSLYVMPKEVLLAAPPARHIPDPVIRVDLPPPPPATPARRQASGCGCFVILLLLGAAGYGGYVLYDKEIRPKLKGPAAKEDPFEFDHFKSWSSFRVGAWRRIQVETPGGTYDETMTVSTLGPDRVTLQVAEDRGKSSRNYVFTLAPGGCLWCQRPISEHTRNEITRESRERLKVAGRDVDCFKKEGLWYSCDGRPPAGFRAWYSKEVPGWLVRWEWENNPDHPTYFVRDFQR